MYILLGKTGFQPKYSRVGGFCVESVRGLDSAIDSPRTYLPILSCGLSISKHSSHTSKPFHCSLYMYFFSVVYFTCLAQMSHIAIACLPAANIRSHTPQESILQKSFDGLHLLHVGSLPRTSLSIQGFEQMILGACWLTDTLTQI